MKEPPDIEELKQLASLGRLELLDLLNPGSKAFKDKKLDYKKITSLEAGELITENPRIMYRPLLTDGEHLVVGFKPEEMEKLL